MDIGEVGSEIAAQAENLMTRCAIILLPDALAEKYRIGCHPAVRMRFSINPAAVDGERSCQYKQKRLGRVMLHGSVFRHAIIAHKKVRRYELDHTADC